MTWVMRYGFQVLFAQIADGLDGDIWHMMEFFFGVWIGSLHSSFSTVARRVWKQLFASRLC